VRSSPAVAIDGGFVDSGHFSDALQLDGGDSTG
jgi:hypothetical protein